MAIIETKNLSRLYQDGDSTIRAVDSVWSETDEFYKMNYF